jgi:hypothetical protein
MKIYSVLYSAYEHKEKDMYVNTDLFVSKEEALENFEEQKKEIKGRNQDWWVDEDESDVFSMENEKRNSKVMVELLTNII